MERMNNQDQDDSSGQQDLSPEKLRSMIDAYNRQRTNSQSNKERIESLMKRKSSLKWTSRKKSRMVRRYMTADRTIAECDQLLIDLRERLDRVSVSEK